jgi:hypothetical protein
MLTPDDHERLVRWVDDDLADIDDAEMIREARSLLECSGIAASGLSVKQAFIEAFFSRDSVQAAFAEMVDPKAILRRRRMIREPLPTLDGLMMLAPDPFSRGQLERAAALAHAALHLRTSEPERHSGILGTTLIPGPDADHIVEAQDPVSVAVLADGRPYLISAASRSSLEELQAALAAILADAPGRSPSEPLRAITSATRPTCHALRARLLSEPENARAIAAIEGALFVLCLDSGSPSPASPASLTTAACGIHCRRENRWYGAPQIIVDAQGHAGVSVGYTRGAFAAQCISFGEALFSRSRGAVLSSPGAGRPGLLDPINALSLRCSEDEPLLLAGEAEAAAAFHSEAPIFSLAVDWAWFKAAGFSPNAALQYLLILAAHDTWGGETPPTLTHAVAKSGQGSSLDWILAPTHGLSELRGDWLRRACSDERLLSRFRAFAARLAAKVDACRREPSPALLFSKPTLGSDERLLRLFLRAAEHYDSGYRGYLFRATRAPGTIDLVTSTLNLPNNVPYMGRPGATTLGGARLGMHILPRERTTELIYIPHPRHSGDLPRFHARLEYWLGELTRVVRT